MCTGHNIAVDCLASFPLDMTLAFSQQSFPHSCYQPTKLVHELKPLYRPQGGLYLPHLDLLQRKRLLKYKQRHISKKLFLFSYAHVASVQILGHDMSFGNHFSSDSKVKFRVSYTLLLKSEASVPKAGVMYSGYAQDYPLACRKEIFELLFIISFQFIKLEFPLIVFILKKK